MFNHDEKDIYKTLLESTKAIPWAIDWKTKQFVYVGPQIEQLLGWKQDSWQSAQDWIDRMHPDYRDEVANYCIAQSENGIDHEADYPAATKDGDYIWIRDVVHVIREDGVTKEIIGFMFDISERKKLENELILANKKLETFSFQDGLTGIANRRMYDSTLKSEWARAQRSQHPISMLLIDIDHFKKYNDHHGHFEGDKCLEQIAQALNGITTRSTDLCARYGGEEFVILLPDIEKNNALAIAEKARQAVCELKIPHGASSISNIITISVGVSTAVPEKNLPPSSLFESTDKMLYQAKKIGTVW